MDPRQTSITLPWPGTAAGRGGLALNVFLVDSGYGWFVVVGHRNGSYILIKDTTGIHVSLWKTAVTRADCGSSVLGRVLAGY